METPSAKPRASPPPPGADIVPIKIVELVAEVYPSGTRELMLGIITKRVATYHVQGRLDLVDAYLLTEEATMMKIAAVLRKQKRRDIFSVVGKAVVAAVVTVGVQFVAFQFGLHSIW